jgi:Metallo-beta-lactamase superfamily
MQRHRITPDITVLSDYAEVPGIGFLPVNTFVLHSEQPVVVDTGLSTPDKDYLSALAEAIDPEDVRWVWLTHPDRDHTGGLWQLMEAAPEARLITTFGGVGIMSCQWQVPLHRVWLLNPGQSIDVGDRTLTACRPPLFDSPVTVGFQESRGGALFSSDCFGGAMPTAELATGPDLRDVSADERRAAQLLWATVDSPWVRLVDRRAYRRAVDDIRGLAPSAVLSTHLPPAIGMNDQLFETLLNAPDGPEFSWPDQSALEAMLLTFEPDIAGTGSPRPIRRTS